MSTRARTRPRTAIRRLPKRGAADRALIESVLDEALVSHIGIVHEGYPVVVPTLHARVGDRLYIHGSAASRMLRNLTDGAQICLTATLIDGLVLARSAFRHSVNYRSVMIYGHAEVVTGAREKERALEAFSEQLVPGRWAEIRWPNGEKLLVSHPEINRYHRVP